MSKVAIIGAGKIGEMICTFLVDLGGYEATLVDASEKQLELVPDRPGLNKICMDVTDIKVLGNVLAGHFAVLSACPYFLTVPIARAAAAEAE